MTSLAIPVRRATLLPPVVAFLLLVGLRDAGLRALVVMGVPLVVAAATFHRWPRGAQAAGASTLGALALGAGVIAHSAPVLLAGLAALALGVARAWGINRGLRRRRAWGNRVGTTIGALLMVVFVAYPTLTSVGYLAKPRQPIHESALGLPHAERRVPCQRRRAPVGLVGARPQRRRGGRRARRRR